MAERRMFTKKITESDAFLDMPLSAQALYFHINMAADDEGFVNNPRKIQRMINASDDDYNLLIMKSFLIAYDSGVIVVKHWKMHNYIQKDRFHPTVYQEEKKMLKVKENGSYTLDVNGMDTTCIQNGYKMDTEVRLGKDSIGKVKKNNGQPKLTEYPKEYLDLYDPYPKHVGKKDGLKRYKALRKIYTYEQIELGVVTYYEYKFNENGGKVGDTKYWKDFDTLLNQLEEWIQKGEEKKE